MRWPLRVLGAIGALWALVAISWWIAVRAADFPSHLLDKASATSLVVADANGVLLRQEATSAGLRERWISADQISPHLIHATLASEDHEFYDHAGVDWSALARAAWLNLRGGDLEFGGSTITMQLVRLTANPSRSVAGKIRQMILAGRLERSLSKREILEQYFNRVYYGNGAWGAEQAARVYFGKSAAELSVGEAAMLAVIPRGPTFYDPFATWSRVAKRRSHILGLMEKRGHLSADARALAERIPIDLESHRPQFRAPHFVELVKERLPPAFQQGATIRTTLDWNLQRHIEVALTTHLDRLSSRNVTQSAIVVLRNSDGAILALVGSKDYTDAARNGAFNGVTARLRPGSTLKPFVYGAAIEMGDTPATIAHDVVLPEDAHQFYTKDVKSHGFARYREALAGSFNLSAVHTLQRVGVETVLRKLRTAGLTTLDRPDADYDWGLAIGHAETRLLDLTAAFTTFGRGGRPITPRTIEVARSATGEIWSEPTVLRPRVFSEEVSYLMFDILSDPDARKPMFGDRVPLHLPFPVALKTGTTKAYTDLWAIGVTREYTVGVWAGNFDGTPTHRVMSTEGATPLVRAAYTAIAARFGDPTAPPRPDAVTSAAICPVSGKRPGPHCDHSKHELFITGHVPDETCDWHQQVCGVPAIVYPKPIRGWAQFSGRTATPTCDLPLPPGPVRITYPIDGARFLLEPHRPATAQRPPLAANVVAPDLRWTINGEPAETWIPAPGTHRVVVARGDAADAITISYE
ncbi:MAG: transglycosylase domain-containing protein [Deltaproteobacteria bacterium]|nr:transglycosylase domain-containing protein [Deltaproteobacteria bacterium]